MITITKTTNGLDVNFNSYFDDGKTNVKKGYWHRSVITRVLNHGTYIEVCSIDHEWLMSTDGTNGVFGVGTVDGLAPVSIDDLYLKIVAALE